MSTRATAIVHDEWKDEPVCAIYKHWDGYPGGFGEELRSFCRQLRVVNGLTLDTARVANGMGCLAAQIVAHLKQAPGDVYLTSPASAEDEEYVYRVRYGGADEPAVVTCDQDPAW